MMGVMTGLSDMSEGYGSVRKADNGRLLGRLNDSNLDRSIAHRSQKQVSLLAQHVLSPTDETALQKHAQTYSQPQTDPFSALTTHPKEVATSINGLATKVFSGRADSIPTEVSFGRALEFKAVRMFRYFAASFLNLVSVFPDKINGKSIGFGAMPYLTDNNLQDLRAKYNLNDGEKLTIIGCIEPWEFHELVGNADFNAVCKRNNIEWKVSLQKDKSIDPKGDFTTMEEAADGIHHALSDKGNSAVYVHCRAGVGRSGLSMATFLQKYRPTFDPSHPLSANKSSIDRYNDVLKYVQEKRPEADFSLSSRAQERAAKLGEFESYLKKKDVHAKLLGGSE